MTNQNRAQRKAGKNGTAAQSAKTREWGSGKTPKKESAKPPTAPAAISALIIPAQAAIRFNDALEGFWCRTSEAGSLCLMLAANIKWHIESFAGWEEFDGHSAFAKGAFGFARAAMDNLCKTADDFAALHTPLAEGLREIRESIEPAPRELPEDDDILSNLNPLFKQGFPMLEDSTNAMLETLELLGVTLYTKGGNCKVGFFASQLAMKNLEKAQTAFWEASWLLRKAAVSVEWQRRGEQRAAA